MMNKKDDELTDLLKKSAERIVQKLMEASAKRARWIKRYDQVLGKGLGNQFLALEENLWRAQATWEDYKAAGGDGSIDSGAAIFSLGRFGLDARQRMWRETILAIARLTDGCAEHPRRNLKNREQISIRLTEGMCGEGPEKTRLRKLVHASIKTACEATKQIRQFRNKCLGHTDRAAYEKGSCTEWGEELADDKIENALRAINGVLNIIRKERIAEDTSEDVRLGNGGDPSRHMIARVSQMMGVIRQIRRLFGIGPSELTPEHAQERVEHLKTLFKEEGLTTEEWYRLLFDLDELGRMEWK